MFLFQCGEQQLLSIIDCHKMPSVVSLSFRVQQQKEQFKQLQTISLFGWDCWRRFRTMRMIWLEIDIQLDSLGRIDINRESFTKLSIPSWNWIFFKTKRLPSLYYSWIYLFSYFIWMIVHIIWITIYPRFAIQLSHLFINEWLIMVISL